MKYLSVLFFSLLLAWTWNVINTEQAISFETHAGIQEKLAQTIQQAVLNKKPNATHFEIVKIWTEPRGADKVVAHYVYRFQEADSEGKPSNSTIAGNVVLEHQTDDGSGMDRWRPVDTKVTSDSIVFDEPLVVTPGGEPEAPPSVTPEPNVENH